MSPNEIRAVRLCADEARSMFNLPVLAYGSRGGKSCLISLCADDFAADM